MWRVGGGKKTMHRKGSLSHLHEMNLNFFSTYTFFDDIPNIRTNSWWSIICSQRPFAFSIRLCQSHSLSVSLNSTTIRIEPFSLVFHSDKTSKPFWTWKYILQCLAMQWCDIWTVCFHLFVGATEMQTKVVCMFCCARMWFGASLKKHPLPQLDRYFKQLAHWIKYASV